MNKIFLSIVAFLFSVQATSASITPADAISAARWYKVYWSGIHVADLRMQVTDGELDAVIKSYGIVKKISKYESRFKTTFDYVDGKYQPLSYFTEFQLRNGGRKIDIKYGNDGIIKQEDVTPPDNRSKRPAVENLLKKNTADPLTAFMIARQKIKESLLNNEDTFSVNMYDGRRLSKLDFKIHGRFKRKIKKQKHDIVKVTFKRHPLEGYTQNELQRMGEEEPVFTLYLSDDEYLMPIKADAEAPLGVAVILLEKECVSIEECGI